MNAETWAAVDQYLNGLFVPNEGPLCDALASSEAAGLPAIQVPPLHGKLLMILARLARATRILEIGTLGGYSTLWLAQALPLGGRVVTLELDPHHAAVARANFARAGRAGEVELHEGAALATLPKLAAAGGPPFDFVFIDADKPSNPEYMTWAVRLSRPGAMIVVDNVIRDGEVIDVDNSDPRVLGVRRLNEQVRSDPRLTVTTIQTVGQKGYDGLLIALVNEVGAGLTSRATSE